MRQPALFISFAAWRSIMKILIISDTHGRLENLYRVLEIEKPVDNLLHLGDFSRDQDEIRAAAECACAFVRGNCDWCCDERDTRDFGLFDHRIHMEHGHMLPDSFAGIAAKAAGLGADIIMYGHTHMPLVHRQNGVYIVNPGSLSKPRQSDRRPSYIIMTIEDGQEPEFEIRYLSD